MKTQIQKLLKASVLVLACMSTGMVNAQTVTTTPNSISNLRSYDQSGINVFESPKDTNTVFNGLKVKFGAGFTQSFQSLEHKNVSGGLYKMTPGFNTASANLYMDVQLADGIRLNLTSY